MFVADGPVSLDDLAKAIEVEPETVRDAVQRLRQATAGRGLCVVRHGDEVQLATAPETGPAIERFLGINRAAKLSPAAMETLAIIAYRQPITRAQVDAVRGVSSDAVIRTLAAKLLIKPVGRLQQAGRPVVYGTTFEFLQYFGISALAELPTLPELEAELAELAPAQEAALE